MLFEQRNCIIVIYWLQNVFNSQVNGRKNIESHIFFILFVQLRVIFLIIIFITTQKDDSRATVHTFGQP